MIPWLGIGYAPAIFALFLYSVLPILRNTHAGLADDPAGAARIGGRARAAARRAAASGRVAARGALDHRRHQDRCGDQRRHCDARRADRRRRLRPADPHRHPARRSRADPRGRRPGRRSSRCWCRPASACWNVAGCEIEPRAAGHLRLRRCAGGQRARRQSHARADAARAGTRPDAGTDLRALRRLFAAALPARHREHARPRPAREFSARPASAHFRGIQDRVARDARHRASARRVGCRGHPVLCRLQRRSREDETHARHHWSVPRFAGRIFSVTQVARGKPAPDIYLFAAAQMAWSLRAVWLSKIRRRASRPESRRA